MDIRLLNREKAYGCEIFKYAEVSSTNDVASAMAHSGAPEFTIVAAGTQLSGRGRNGAVWVSPPGCGAYMSMILRPASDSRLIPFFSIMAGVAACDAVTELSGLSAGVKWPNDVLVNGRKIAGILCEAEFSESGSKPHTIIVGVGVNVNTSVHLLPRRPLYPSTSIAAETGRIFDVDDMIAVWAREMHRRMMEMLSPEGAAALSREWNLRSVFNGLRISVDASDRGAVEGICLGIDETGAMRIRLDSGEIAHIFSGTVNGPA